MSKRVLKIATHLTDCSRLKMKILLLRVTSLTLEALIAKFSIDQHLTSEDADASTAISQAIQQCGLASTRHTH